MWSRLQNFLRRIPFTLVMLAGLIIAAWVTNTYIEQITQSWLDRAGFAPRDLWLLDLERLFTSALITGGGIVFWEAILMVSVFVGSAEWLTGWKRTAITFWGVHLLALLLLSLIISLSLHQLSNFGLEASEIVRDVGPSAGYFACLGLVSARLKRPWHWISGGILFSVFVIALFLPVSTGESAELKFSADLAHLLAFPLGWLSNWVGRRQILFQGKST